MILKPGVKLRGIRPEVVVALIVADGIWNALGVDLVVTSCAEGTHSRGSLHYSGSAVDLRTLGINPTAAAQRLKLALGADFDVVLETDHIHVEYQPKDPL